MNFFCVGGKEVYCNEVILWWWTSALELILIEIVSMRGSWLLFIRRDDDAGNPELLPNPLLMLFDPFGSPSPNRHIQHAAESLLPSVTSISAIPSHENR